jgi:hypothetical protein
MGFQSQSGQVGFGIQSVKGTAVAATRFIRLRGGSLGGQRELLIPDPEIGGNRDVPQAYLGPIAYAGSYDFYTRLQSMALLLKGALGTVSSSNVAGSAEVQTVTITGTPTGGTFTLTFRGQTTSAIAYNATNATVQTAVQALTTIGAGNATVSGGPGPGTPWVITFASALATGNQREFTANGALLTGGTSPAIAVTETTPGASPTGTHIITPIDGNQPWITVEERVGQTWESFKYTDAKITGLKFEADAAGYMGGSVDLIALSQLAGFTAQANPAWDVSPMITGNTITVSWNGVALPAKSFNFEISNGIEDNDFRLGSFTLGDAVEKRREFKMGVTIRPNDSLLWHEATNGGSALTTPRGGRASYGALTITASTFETTNGTTPYSLSVTVPTAAMQPFKADPKGDDVIEHNIDFVLLRDDPLVPVCTFTIVDDLATVV